MRGPSIGAESNEDPSHKLNTPVAHASNHIVGSKGIAQTVGGEGIGKTVESTQIAPPIGGNVDFIHDAVGSGTFNSNPFEDIADGHIVGGPGNLPSFPSAVPPMTNEITKSQLSNVTPGTQFDSKLEGRTGPVSREVGVHE